MEQHLSKESAIPPSISMKVLIVEDDVPCYMYIKEILEIHGIYFYHVKNGKDAVDMISEHSDIGLILMDILLPDLNGLEATRRIKNLKPDIPIIIQSAYSNEEEINCAFRAGCSDYLIKPFSVKTLIDKIEEYGVRL